MSFTKFIPSDAPNHDDWNELFNDPAKLEGKLILNDDSKFFMSDPAERFGFLHKVDWTESLRGSKHRELHSMWGLFASAHQFWFLHILMFALTMFWVARDDSPISVICFVSRVCIPHAQCCSSLAIVTAAASTCFVPDLRSVLVTCFKSLFPLWVVSQLFTKSAPLESECLEERIEIPPDDGDDGRGGDW